MIYRLRMRLARLVAPVVIMPDPFPGDGAFLVMRQNGFTTNLRASRLRCKATQRLAQYDYDPDRPFEFHRSKRFVRFVGTVE